MEETDVRLEALTTAKEHVRDSIRDSRYVERLRDERVTTRSKGGVSSVVHYMGRNGDDDDVLGGGVVPERFRRLPPIHVGHAEVHEHHRGFAFAGKLQRGGSVLRFNNRETSKAQVFGQHLSAVVEVIDYENVRLR
jgi:hypothetical protein